MIKSGTSLCSEKAEPNPKTHSEVPDTANSKKAVFFI
jgi:hypothetical protein